MKTSNAVKPYPLTSIVRLLSITPRDASQSVADSAMVMTHGNTAPNQNAFSYCINCDCTGQARRSAHSVAVPKCTALPPAVQKCLNRGMELPPELKSPLLPDLSVDELDDNE